MNGFRYALDQWRMLRAERHLHKACMLAGKVQTTGGALVLLEGVQQVLRGIQVVSASEMTWAQRVAKQRAAARKRG